MIRWVALRVPPCRFQLKYFFQSLHFMEDNNRLFYFNLPIIYTEKTEGSILEKGYRKFHFHEKTYLFHSLELNLPSFYFSERF